MGRERLPVDLGVESVEALGLARVGLLQRLEPELREAEPRGPNLCGLADIEAEAPDRQGVRRGGGAEVDVEGSVHLRHGCAVPEPAPLAVRGEREADGML